MKNQFLKPFLVVACATTAALMGAQPAQAGVCNDPWINQAVKEVTGQAPTGNGTSGDCSPDYYSANYGGRGAGRWSSYQDILNKVRVKKTGQGVAYVFLAPNQAVYAGHVNWAYVGDDGRYYGGSTDTNGNLLNYIMRRFDYDTEIELLRRMRDYWPAPNNYTEYRVAVCNNRYAGSAASTADSITRYFLGGNNCMDHTYKVLAAYGMTGMPLTQTNWLPRVWFANFPGAVGYFSNVRGVRKSVAAQPIRLSDVEKLEEHRGFEFVPPVNTLARPTTDALLRASVIKVTGEHKTRGAQMLVSAKAPPASKRLLSIPRVVGQPADYKGIGALRLYSNQGAPDVNRASGAAALATVVDFYSLLEHPAKTSFVNQVYKMVPPDLSVGIQGMSRKQMESGLKMAHLTSTYYSGKAALKTTLAQNMPALVLMDVGAAPEAGWKTWGTFWTVAYAYDKDGVYLSNWPGDGKCSWATFNKAWDTGLTRAAGSANLFLCPQPQVITRVAAAK